MSKTLMFIYGIVVYVIFLLVFLYAIGFVGDFLVPKSIDVGGQSASLGLTLLIDAILLGLFALQHSIMARPGFKRVWTKIIPKPIERSTYVLFASLILALIFWQWRPISTPVWHVQNAAVAGVLWALFAIGWLIVLAATFMIDHADLFGLRQVYLHLRQQEKRPHSFTTKMFYQRLRHPIMAGFIVAFWATPYMTWGHLFFAVMTTGYILVGIAFEERDLIGYFGQTYVDYKKQVPALVPLPKHKSLNPPESSSAPEGIPDHG